MKLWFNFIIIKSDFKKYSDFRIQSFYKQLKNKQLGPVFAKKLSNFLSNFWPDFQPEILSNFY